MAFGLAALTGPRAWAQAPAWQTAVAFGTGSSPDLNRYHVTATAADASDNLYVAGIFLGTVSFGSSTLNSISTGQGSGDAFVAKWSGATNAFVYAQRIGQASATAAVESGEIHTLAVSGPNVYAAGICYGTVRFGSATGAVTLTTSNNGSSNAFVARLTDSGTTGGFVWARAVNNATGTTFADGRVLAVSGPNVYLAGQFSGSAGFGGTTLTSVSTQGTGDVFVAKLTDAATGPAFVWALRGGGTQDEVLTAMAVSGQNVYVAGTFNSATAVFGSASLTNAGSGQRDVFVAQVVDGGTTAGFPAAQRAGGTGDDRVYANALAAGPAGVYLAGNYDATPLTFGSMAVPAAASSSVLARWNPATGAFNWVQPAPGAAYPSPNTLSYRNLATNGNSLYLAGDFSGTVALGGGLTLTSTVAGDQNLWVGKFSDTGTGVAAAWAKQAGGDYPETVNNLVLSGTTLHVQGNTGSATLNFAPLSLTNPYYTGQYNSGACLASLTDATLTATARPKAGAVAVSYFPTRPTRRPPCTGPAAGLLR